MLAVIEPAKRSWRRVWLKGEEVGADSKNRNVVMEVSSETEQ